MPAESCHVGPTEDCPHPELWSAVDAAASEDEVGDFLYGLVRILKPKLVIETGCYLGYTSAKIAEAIKENEFGRFETCDTQISYVNAASAACNSWFASVHNCQGIALIGSLDDVDLAFIDSGGDRLEEAKALKLSKHGIIVLHDSRHESVKDFGKQLGMVEIFLPTPRGISIFKRSL